MFFKTGNLSISSFDFLKRFSTLSDLLIDLLNEKISIHEAKLEQEEMIGKICKLKSFILLEEEGITEEKAQSNIKKQREKHKEKRFLHYKKVF